MAAISISRYLFSFYLSIFFYFATFATEPVSAISSRTLTRNSNFDSEIALFGDAEVVDGGSHVTLTRPSISSSGLLMSIKPFRFIEGNLSKPTSFATEFTFSISPGNGDGLVLVFVPKGFASKFGSGPFGLSREIRFLGVEFDTAMDGNVGDLNANHIGVDIGSLVSVSVSNVSSMNLVLNSGEKLKSWIDYDASSKRLEVRLSKFGDSRPYNPIIAHRVDMVEMWGGEDVFVGISSSSGNSLQTSSIYSWSSRLKRVPTWMHSLPVDPRGYSGEQSEIHDAHTRRVCPLKILAGMIFAIGCGALLAFTLLFLWAIFVNRHTVLPAEYKVHPVVFRYEKINVVVEKDGKDPEAVKN